MIYLTLSLFIEALLMNFFGGAMMNASWEFLHNMDKEDPRFWTDLFACVLLLMFGVGCTFLGTMLIYWFGMETVDAISLESLSGVTMIGGLLVALASAILVRTTGDFKNPQPKFAIPLYGWING